MTQKNELIKTIARKLEEKAIELEILDGPQSDKGRIQLEFGIGKILLVNSLIGGNLYSKNTIVVGELLRNAVDSCYVRKNLDPSYTPEILVYISKDKLVIEDNGAGMTPQKIESLLSMAKTRFPPLETVKHDAFSLARIGSFGIGILSCLSIATRISIESKPMNKPAWRVIIENSPEKWHFEEGLMSEQGTKLTIWLDDDGKKKDISGAIREFAKTLDIPILVIEETPKMKPTKKTEMSTNYVYAIWLKVDESLPWIELKGTYITRDGAQKAGENLVRNMKIRIVSIPKGRPMDKSKITEILSRTREFGENT